MGKRSRIKRERLEYFQLLTEQVDFMVESAAAFDWGRESEAKRLATVIRTLVHQTGRSRALLSHLGQRDSLNVLSSGSKRILNNIATHHRLIYMVAMNDGDAGYRGWLRPLCSGEWRRPNEAYMPLEAWWNEEVFAIIARDKNGNYLPFPIHMRIITRRDLVSAVANTDGGAHVDEALDETLRGVSRSCIGVVHRP